MRLAIPVLLNCALVLGVYLADKYTAAKKLPSMAKQIIIGLLFGGVSAFASSYGVEWLGTTVNVRDAAPLSAGLIFGEKYPTSMMKIRDYVFIVFNVPSLEEFLQNLTEKYFVTLMDILDNELQKKNTRNLPYGFYTDENGDLKVDLKAAAEVRKIYDMYIDTQSIRDIAAELRTNFSDIREILHDAQEYMQMREKIVSPAKLKQVMELMASNVRGGATAKQTMEQQIADARRRRKQSQQRAEQLQG